MADETQAASYEREQGLADLIYFARQFLGFTKSKLEYVNAAGEKVRSEKEGPEYGISRLGPHLKAAALLKSPSQAKLLSFPRDGYKTSLEMCDCTQDVVINPDIRILYAQRTKREAQKKIDAIARMVNSPKVFNTYGVKLVKDGENWIAETRSPHIVDPTLEAGGVDSELTGSHRDKIVADDLTTWLSIRNPEQMQKTRAYFDLLQPLLDPMGKLVVIGTPYSYGDLMHEIMTTMADEFEILVMDCGMLPVDAPGQALKLTGKPRFAHLTEEYLLSRLKRMGRKHFMANYCARIVSEGDETFRREQFRSRLYTPAIARSVRGFILTDTAVSAKDTSCFRVIAVVGLDANDVAYLFDMRVGRWPAQMIAVHACDLIEKWTGQGLKIAKGCLENITLNHSIYENIKAEMRARGLSLRWIFTPRSRAQGDKDTRIETMGFRFEQGNFLVMSSVPTHFDDGGDQRLLYSPDGWVEDGIALPSGELVDEFVRFRSPGVFKDIPDCLADLDVCDKDGTRILRGAGRPPRLDVWAKPSSAMESKDQEQQVREAIQAEMRKMQLGTAKPPPRHPGHRRVAGERWRYLRPPG